MVDLDPKKLDPRQLRKDKTNPCEDMRHVLRIGLPLCVVLFLLLPFIIR